MGQDSRFPLMVEIQKVLCDCGISIEGMEPYHKIKENAAYLVNNDYIIKVSTSEFVEQRKLDRVKTLRLAPKIYAAGLFNAGGIEYHYIIYNYIQGNDLWSIASSLSDAEQCGIGKEIARFLEELHIITDDYYDIGHYVPTIPRSKKSWKDGHLEYVGILMNGLSIMDIERDNQKTIEKAFTYIHENIDSLHYQGGARLLHNDLHPKNIIINEAQLSGIIDWECSQYGEADFELTHMFHWCVFPETVGNNLNILLSSVIKNLRVDIIVPNIEKRMTIYQLEHELNQLIWCGKSQEDERVQRMKGWLDDKVGIFI